MAQLDLAKTAWRFGTKRPAVEAVLSRGGGLEFNLEAPERPIVGVDLSNTAITDEDLDDLVQALEKLPSLGRLNLADTALTDRALAVLNRVPSLHHLDLSGTKVTDVGLSEVKGFSKLQTLRLARTAVTAEGARAALDAAPETHLRIYRGPGAAAYFRDEPPDFHVSQEQFILEAFAEDLHAMGEPPLAPDELNPPDATFRLYWCRSFDKPTVVRIEPAADDTATLRIVQLDRAGNRGGIIVLDRRIGLSADDWQTFQSQMRSERFQRLPSVLWNSGIADGSAYVLEGVDQGRYHLVLANTNTRPGKTFGRFLRIGRAMMWLADKELYEAWVHSEM
jgi:hypothetical protein